MARTSVPTLRLVLLSLLCVALVSSCVQEDARTFRLSVSSSSEGGINVNGASHTVPWSGSFAAGTTVTLLAVPEPGRTFRSWSGDLVSTNNPTGIVINSDVDVVANFSGAPALVVTPSSGKFGPVDVSSNRAIFITVANHGEGLLTGTAETSDPFSIADGAAFHLASGESQRIEIHFDPIEEGPASGELRLITSVGSTTVHLSGTGSLSPVPLRQLGVILVGDGMIYSEPGGIVCPGACTASFAEHSKVVLSVTPHSTADTPRWSGCDSPTAVGFGSATCEISVHSDHNVLVDLTPSPNLVVTPATGDFGTVVTETARDTTFTLSNHGSEILSGTAEVSGPFNIVSGAAYHLSTGQAHEIVIRFEPVETGHAEGELRLTTGSATSVPLSGYGSPATSAEHRLSVNVVGHGRVTSEPPGIDCPGECSAVFPSSTGIRLTSSPASPVGRAEWQGCDTAQQPDTDLQVCELTLVADRSVDVEFPPTEDVTVTLSPGIATLFTSDSRAFTATVAGSSDTAVQWTTTAGQITGTGQTVTYTAPSEAGTYVLTATSEVDPSRSAHAIVTVAAREVISVAAGGEFSVALKNDGTVWAWGSNQVGQLGTGTNVDSTTPVQITALYDIVKVAAGKQHALALRSDGAVLVWGGGFGTSTPQHDLAYASATDIAAGAEHSLVLTSDGKVWAWGANHAGQLGDGTAESRTWTQDVATLRDIVAISAGRDHSLAVDASGRVFAWGMNDSGQVGVRYEGDDCGLYYWCLNEPRHVGQWAGSLPVAGGTASMILTDYGSLYVWGNNGMGQLGVPTTDECWQMGDAAGYWCSFSPVRVPGLPAISSVAVGAAHTLAITLDGEVYSWGSAMNGELGVPSSDGCTPGATPVFTCSRTPLQVTMLSGAVSVAAGGSHSLAVLSNGTVWAWGSNAHGQLGDSTWSTRTSPVLIQVP